MFFFRLVQKPVEVGVLPDEVVVGMRLWPRVEVLSFCVSVGGGEGEREGRYGDDVVFFHEAWFVSCEETEHTKHECANCAEHRE